MELREVRSFVMLAEQLHFGRAADLLHLSQPALTKQIRRLEEEIGGDLLSRGRHGAKLTSLGHQFLRGARLLVRDADELLAQTRSSATGESGRLNIGFGFHTLSLVPRVLVQLRKVAPAAELTLRDMSTAEQVDALHSEKIDIGFVRLPIGREFSTMPVIGDRLILVSRQAHGTSARLTLDDCRESPFVLISRQRSPTMHQHTLALCAKHGFHPRSIQDVDEVTTALALVQAGMGVTMIPESFAGTRFPGVRFHPLREAEARWRVGAAWRKGDSNPLLARFLALLKQDVRKSRK